MPAIAATPVRHVTLIEVRRPPHNFIDLALLSSLADAFDAANADPQCRAIVLAAQGRSFCAGADPAAAGDGVRDLATARLYEQGLRLFSGDKPVVAAVHGAAVGGGLGLAMVADFRITCDEARFSANFARLGFHPGFGLTVTLPRVVGPQQAALMFMTGRRIRGTEATRIGLADLLVPQDQVRQAALDLAGEIAASAPLAVQSTRRTLCAGWTDAVRLAVAQELAHQRAQFASADFVEGRAAALERREPKFVGK